MLVEFTLIDLNTPQSQDFCSAGTSAMLSVSQEAFVLLGFFFFGTSEIFPGFRPIVTLSQKRQGNTPAAFSFQVSANFQDI